MFGSGNDPGHHIAPYLVPTSYRWIDKKFVNKKDPIWIWFLFQFYNVSVITINLSVFVVFNLH